MWGLFLRFSLAPCAPQTCLLENPTFCGDPASKLASGSSLSVLLAVLPGALWSLVLVLWSLVLVAYYYFGDCDDSDDGDSEREKKNSKKKKKKEKKEREKKQKKEKKEEEQE